MNKKLAVCLFSLIGCFAILSSMESYKQRSLALLAKPDIAFGKEAKGLRVFAKSYKAHESHAYLSTDLLQLGYQPIQITVQNNTPVSYGLSTEGISLPADTAGKVASSITKRAIPRAIGLKIASFFLWPFMIPSTIDTLYTVKAHLRLSNDFSAKCVKEKEYEEIVAPYSTYNRVIFVPKKEMRDTLTVTLSEQGSSKFVSFISPLNFGENHNLEPVK